MTACKTCQVTCQMIKVYIQLDYQHLSLSGQQMPYFQLPPEDPSHNMSTYIPNIIRNESWSPNRGNNEGLEDDSILGKASKSRLGGDNNNFEEEKDTRANYSTISKTRQIQSAFASSNATTSKKRTFNEISGDMSL